MALGRHDALQEEGAGAIGIAPGVVLREAGAVRARDDRQAVMAERGAHPVEIVGGGRGREMDRIVGPLHAIRTGRHDLGERHGTVRGRPVPAAAQRRRAPGAALVGEDHVEAGGGLAERLHEAGDGLRAGAARPAGEQGQGGARDAVRVPAGRQDDQVEADLRALRPGMVLGHEERAAQGRPGDALDGAGRKLRRRGRGLQDGRGEQRGEQARHDPSGKRNTGATLAEP